MNDVLTSAYNSDLFQHLYGAVNGIFLMSGALMIMMALSYYRKQSLTTPDYLGAFSGYLLVGISFLGFGLYNVFSQHFTQAVSIQVIPNWLLWASQFGAPIALGCITYIFLSVTQVTSAAAYTFQVKYHYLIKCLYLLDIIAIASLSLSNDLKTDGIINSAIYIPHCFGAVIYCFLGLRKTPFAKLMGGLFVFMTLTFSLFTYDIYTNQFLNNNTAMRMVLIHCIFACTHTIFTFAVLRIGHSEIERFANIDSEDVKILHGFGKALKRNEFFLEFQPQINLDTRQVYGVEALIRWEHPTMGIISPNRFIPLAERTEKIGDITRWVISEALQEIAQLHDKGHKIRLSINLSAKNLNQSMISYLKEQLKKHQVPAHSLTIEITETVKLVDDLDTRAFLAGMEELGMELSLDDYGTGFSSLAYINQLCLSEIKIDRSFITDISQNEDHFIIADSTTKMSRSLGIKTIAEGVETQSALERLQQIGCHYVQGYYIARPMQANVLRDWLSTPFFGEKTA